MQNYLSHRLAQIGRPAVTFLEHVTGIWRLAQTTLFWTFVAPFCRRVDSHQLGGRSYLYRQSVPMMEAIGLRSFGIVFLVAMLIGGILVLQTGDMLRSYGQLAQLPGLVAISMTRELGPLMTAIVLTARVGAAYTAGLGSMKIADEILALDTMAINPVGYLVAPRFLAALVMTPCLVIWANLIGMGGGYALAHGMYDIGWITYVQSSLEKISVGDTVSGIVKATVFGGIIGLVPCYFGFIVHGGPEGIGRSTMVSVVTTLVSVILANFLITGIMTLYL